MMIVAFSGIVIHPPVDVYKRQGMDSTTGSLPLISEKMMTIVANIAVIAATTKCVCQSFKKAKTLKYKEMFSDLTLTL